MPNKPSPTGGPPPPLFVTFLLCLSTGVAFALDKYLPEKQLKTLLKVKKGDELIWLAFAAGFLMIVNNFLGSLVVSARKHFKIGHPITYPTLSEVKDNASARFGFMSVVRGHENFHEFMATFQVMFVVVGFVMGLPITTACCMMAFGLGRMLYGMGYSVSPALRLPGFLVSMIPALGLLGTMVLYLGRKYAGLPF
eukprot:NODE_1592_length_801_cov_78.047478_g1543_i0.p1 GENE.NODE_1592_length_801_cov_78.047478_g1543_i0~~NODE_1592_length_801_cov_78.047478_g1543_i0.p1  ORF type:complete len:195 (-),score=36.11 NODE_1592_length_801_cov_78.047478_g1543_i0:93-677(-)